MGIAVWCQDEAGPFSTSPCPGATWRKQEHPAIQPHEYLRQGTAKFLTLFHPATGEVRVKGVRTVTNVILHTWLKAELLDILATLSIHQDMSLQAAHRPAWERWQAGLSRKPSLPAELPPLRMILIWDNLVGHHTPELMCWLFAHGIIPVFTPIGGSWLNMAESIQRILKRRAFESHHPQSPEEIITWFEETAQGWNYHPTPFLWGGKRKERRQRSRQRRLGGSGALVSNGKLFVA
jgi:transposase